MHRRACISAETDTRSRAIVNERGHMTPVDARVLDVPPADPPQLGHRGFLISCGHAALLPQSPF